MTASVTTCDVLVIGAGVAGLAVASDLVAGGHSVVVAEARDRVGGRVETVPVAGGFADLGPTWFWPGEQRVAALVDRFQLPYHQQYTDGDALVLAEGELRRLGGLNIPPSFRFSNGVMDLVNALASTVPSEMVLLSTPIRSLAPTADGVEAVTDAGTVCAGAGVIALPPSLAIGTGMVDPISLDPDLVQAASDVAVWMGGIVKVVARYAEPFWRKNGLSGLSSCPAGPFGEIHDMSGPGGSPPMLFGFARAEPGQDRIDGTTFVRQLVQLHGEAAASPEEVLVRDWSSERWTTPADRAVSYRFELFGHPAFLKPSWDDRLYWASTETGRVAPGHIEGALEAAERVVASLEGVLAAR